MAEVKKYCCWACLPELDKSLTENFTHLMKKDKEEKGRFSHTLCGLHTNKNKGIEGKNWEDRRLTRTFEKATCLQCIFFASSLGVKHVD